MQLRLLSLSLLAYLVFPCPWVGAASGVFAEAISYTKPLPGGRIFVMLGSLESEQKAVDSNPVAGDKLKALRATYPKTGVYEESTAKPIWQTPDDVFSPIDGTYLSQDARYFVRIEGDWWRTKDFPGGKRPEEPAIAQQLAAPAISFFDQGQLLKSYLLCDLLLDPERIMHSPQHLLWYASGSLNEDSKLYLLFTQDSGKVVFDYQSGAIVSRSAVGLSNPLFYPILVTCGVLSAGILLTWIYLVFLRTSRPTSPG